MTAQSLQGRRLHHPEDGSAPARHVTGWLRSAEARELLLKHREDKDLVVRNAVSRALREGGGAG